jgi:uncharacterized protein (DUF433 family)
MDATKDSRIEGTPGVRGGKPRIAGTRMTVADIAVLYLRPGQSLGEIAARYHLPLAGVYAAMAYYHGHKEGIERSIEDEQAFAEAFRKNNPSLLRDKLQALSRA